MPPTGVQDTVAELGGWYCFQPIAEPLESISHLPSFQGDEGLEEDDDLEAAHEAVREPISTIRHTEARVGRNDPCPCGSGKKYKKCCGRS